MLTWFDALQVEPIRNLFAALFLSSIGMLIRVQFLWTHVDILLASVILVIVVKTAVITIVIKAFGYSIRSSFLVSVVEHDLAINYLSDFEFIMRWRFRSNTYYVTWWYLWTLFVPHRWVCHLLKLENLHLYSWAVPQIFILLRCFPHSRYLFILLEIENAQIARIVDDFIPLPLISPLYYT